MRMQKISKLFFLVLMMVCIFPVIVLADEDGINDISITVNLNKDGSADIVEKWEIDNIYDGTEYYKALNINEGMSVSEFRVKDDQGREYQSMEEWDTSASFNEKAYKSGILETKNGYELCWGISEMGDRTYTLSYHLDGLVKRYSDVDGFYHQFITDGLSSSVKSASVKVKMKGMSFSQENAKIWALGYTGDVWFKSGTIDAKSEGELASDEYMNLLVSFEGGIFDGVLGEGSFEDLKEKAINDNEGNGAALLIILAVIVIFCVLVFLLLYLMGRNIRLADGTKIRRQSLKNVDMTYSCPFAGGIPEIVSAYALDGWSGIALSPIAAYMVKWQLNGNISLKKEGKKKKPVIHFLQEPKEKDDQALFALMQKASKDDSLSISSWGKWAEKHYEKIVKWEEQLKESGNTSLVEMGWAAKDAKAKMRFTASGYKVYVSMLGFFNYLKSFKKPEGKMEASKEYWGDYLIYASLFQLSDDVADGLRSMDSDGFEAFCGHYHMNTALLLYCVHQSSTFSSTAATSVSTGGGGASYSSGGGGFSGGGGGGSR